MTAHAFGKVILLGEHSVVHGRPALAAAVSPGVDAEATPSATDDGLALDVSPWDCRFRPADGSDLGRALGALGAALGVTSGHVRATVHLPGGGGMGSSAALGVATARALADLHGLALPVEALLAAALAWERVFHGNPSGVDHTLAALGGVGVYTRAHGLAPVPLRGALRLLLADSGERARTVDMVSGVARLHQRRPETTERTFDAIAALVRNAELALAAGDLRALGEFMNLNQALLAALMVSTERLEALCAAARTAGALGAKLTGAGGGGCVLALADTPEGESRVLSAWEALGATAFVTEVGA